MTFPTLFYVSYFPAGREYFIGRRFRNLNVLENKLFCYLAPRKNLNDNVVTVTGQINNTPLVKRSGRHFLSRRKMLFERPKVDDNFGRTRQRKFGSSFFGDFSYKVSQSRPNAVARSGFLALGAAARSGAALAAPANALFAPSCFN